MKLYTVKKLSALAKVSVRTLHHYDHIGLLKPSGRSEAGYRLYGDKDLLRLQQIMFYRELDFPLARIKTLLDSSEFDMVKSLEGHRRMLLERNKRTARLIETIDKTIAGLKEERKMLTDEELYEGFSKQEVAQITKEVREKYDPKVVEESNRNLRAMTKERWAEVKKEGDDVTRALAAVMDEDPASPRVQELIARHYAHINVFYKPTPDVYRGLGELYAIDARFRATYDKYAKGLADFLKKAMAVYADRLPRAPR